MGTYEDSHYRLSRKEKHNDYLCFSQLFFVILHYKIYNNFITMKEDNLRKLKNIIEENLNFNIVIKKFGKPKKAFLAFLERALMYMRMYGKYRLARWEMNQMDVVLSAYNEEEMDFFLMDNSKEEAYNYSPSDIEYLRSLNVYSHAERRVRTNLTKERLKDFHLLVLLEFSIPPLKVVVKKIRIYAKRFVLMKILIITDGSMKMNMMNIGYQMI